MALSATSGPMPVGSPRAMASMGCGTQWRSVVAHEGFFLQAFDPLFFLALGFADAQFAFNLVADFRERTGAGGAAFLDLQEPDGVGQIDDPSALPGLKGESGIGKLLAQTFALMPAGIATLFGLGALRITLGHLGEGSALADLAENFVC